MKFQKVIILKVLVLISTVVSFAQCEPSSPISLVSETRIPQLSPRLVSNLNYFYNAASNTRRVIFLVPGLNGDYNAWRDVRDETGGDVDEYGPYPARKAEMRMLGTKNGPGYSQDAGLASAAKDVWDYMSSLNYNQLNVGSPLNNIAIGHSQGGLVLRALEYSHGTLGRTPFFGGLVTFGTPHQGAMILTNGLPVSLGGRGQLGNFIDGFCIYLSEGPIQEQLQLNDNFFFQLVRLLNLDDQALNVRDQICEVMSDSILPHYILKDYTSNITQDYMAHDEGYSFPNYLSTTLNQHQPNMPAVAFYGVEEDPVFWRQLGSIAKKVHSFPAFQADPDQNFVDNYASMLVNYRAKQLLYQQRASDYKAYADVACNIFFSLNPFTIAPSALLCTIYKGKYVRNQKVANAYHLGHDYLKKSNARWKGIIGARKTAITQNGYICDCDNLTTGSNTITQVQNIWECPAGIVLTPQGRQLCQIYANNNITIEEYENDGVVLASSAKQLPGALVNPTLSEQDYRMEKTNHQQMRNSSETAIKLKRLFDFPDYGYFFMTSRL